MSTGQYRFKRSEVIRAIKSVEEAGHHASVVEVTPEGTIRVKIGRPDNPTPAPVEETSEDLRKLL
jgi:hypothetical protein